MSGNLLEDHLAGQHPGTIKIGIRAAMCAALKLTGVTDERDAPQTEPRTIGVLYLDSGNTSAMLSTTTRGALEALAMEAARAIEEARLYRESAEKARIDKELEDAARIQAALLPPPHWSKDRIEVAGRTLPCRAIGGDFFDYFELPDGRLGLSLADVSGKGPPAAMLATRLQAMLSSLAEAGGGPGETLARLNQSLLRRSIAPRFATLAYAVLYPDGRLGTCNAGHNPSIVVGRDGAFRQLSRGGLMLGLFEQPLLEEDWVDLQPGDTLIFFSDGVTEALNAVGEQFGEERLETCLARAPGLSAEAMVECLLHHVNEFAAEVPQFDDVTVLVVKYGAS
jgi:serine phosphatase RsbU (regulator of sigma subunit)